MVGYASGGIAMYDEPAENAGRHQCVRALLLQYLFVAGLPEWPGADGVTTDEVLLTYPDYAAEGRVPGLPALIAHFPEYGDELSAFFAAN